MLKCQLQWQVVVSSRDVKPSILYATGWAGVPQSVFLAWLVVLAHFSAKHKIQFVFRWAPETPFFPRLAPLEHHFCRLARIGTPFLSIGAHWNTIFVDWRALEHLFSRLARIGTPFLRQCALERVFLCSDGHWVTGAMCVVTKALPARQSKGGSLGGPRAGIGTP